MKAAKLYRQLEKDFITSGMKDEWAEFMAPDYLTDEFRKRSMGTVCDFAEDVGKVYTAVFPSVKVMQQVLDYDVRDAMLFVHHPMVWDIRKAPDVFQQMDEGLLRQFRERRISIYNLHVPLDNYGKYSTSVTLARALGMQPEKAFAPYFGALCGGFCSTTILTVEELRERFQEAVGHRVSLYPYGDSAIRDNRVAVIAGGGNERGMLEEVAKAGVNAFVTGITVRNEHSEEAHAYAERNGVSILGGTHYSTESFACIAMVDYFKNLGLESSFMDDKPVMEDM